MTNNAPDPRPKRGLELAKVMHQHFLRIAENMWIVPSASCALHAYVVNVSRVSCTCPSFEETASPCKHLWAVAYLQNEVTLLDGTHLALPPVVGGEEWAMILELESAS